MTPSHSREVSLSTGSARSWRGEGTPSEEVNRRLLEWVSRIDRAIHLHNDSVQNEYKEYYKKRRSRFDKRAQKDRDKEQQRQMRLAVKDRERERVERERHMKALERQARARSTTFKKQQRKNSSLAAGKPKRLSIIDRFRKKSVSSVSGGSRGSRGTVDDEHSPRSVGSNLAANGAEFVDGAGGAGAKGVESPIADTPRSRISQGDYSGMSPESCPPSNGLDTPSTYVKRKSSLWTQRFRGAGMAGSPSARSPGLPKEALVDSDRDSGDAAQLGLPLESPSPTTTPQKDKQGASASSRTANEPSPSSSKRTTPTKGPATPPFNTPMAKKSLNDTEIFSVERMRSPSYSEKYDPGKLTEAEDHSHISANLERFKMRR